MNAAKEQSMEFMHNTCHRRNPWWTLGGLQEDEFAKGSTLMSTTCTHSCQGGPSTAMDLDEALDFMLQVLEQQGCAKWS